ncbi:MAG TPA: TetR/AcrR family transcriptional regulator [Streptosporangiaceae bacterium]|nr:TetR/AcrR family transcriptional regulator [Streptosporangiaceae bacterium]
MATEYDSGRANQKKRTRRAIVEACREIIRSGGPVTMPDVARLALVSEATAYRYFPDLVSLLTEAFPGMWPSPAEALEAVAGSTDPVERVAFACEFLLRGIVAYQGAVRAMISATITRPELAGARPGVRFGLIDQALAPLNDTLGAADPVALARLKVDLAAVASAEALFSLTDLARLAPDDAIASLVRTATTVTDAALREAGVSSPLQR